MSENILEKIINKKRNKIQNLIKEISISTLNEKITNFKNYINFKEKILNNMDHGKMSIIAEIKKELSSDLGSEVTFRRVENVGPKISDELIKSAIIAITLSMMAMLFYVWLRFEWQFGFGAVVALTHDVLFTLGLLSILNVEFSLATIAAILTIAGYSINDTVVIFDRVRENLRKYKKMELVNLFNLSVNHTLSRTVMTSITTLLALISLFIFKWVIDI